jgi:predicted nucleic acid-binding Zn finger protein
VLRIDPNLTNIRENGTISGRDLQCMSSKYGERFWKGIRAATEGCVKRHVFSPSKRQVWTVKGKKMDYLVIDDFYCGCDDFYLNVIIRKRHASCYHVLAKLIAEALGTYESVTSNDDRYLPLMMDLRRSPKKDSRG